MDKNNFGKKQNSQYQSQNESQSSMLSIHYCGHNYCKSRTRKSTSSFFRPRIQNFANLKQGFTEVAKKTLVGVRGNFVDNITFFVEKPVKI